MISVLLAGLGISAGVLLIVTALAPARMPLHTALARLQEAQPVQVHAVASAGARPTDSIGRLLQRTAVGRLVVRRLAGDLRVTGTTAEQLLTRQVLSGLACLSIVPCCLALAMVAGVGVSLVFPLWLSALFGVGGFVLPAFEQRSKAHERRRSFRHALGCFLDLVAVRLAGGAGVESALSDSAAAGHGWAFIEFRQALAEARLMGEPPWTALARLGRDLQVPELGELAASAALAGDEGARVRASIVAKARALRTRGLTDAESNAQAASERMSLPIVLMLIGFIVFLGYPAINQVLVGL